MHVAEQTILAGVDRQGAVSRCVLRRHRSGRRQVEQKPAANRGPVKVGDIGPVGPAIDGDLNPDIDGRAAAAVD